MLIGGGLLPAVACYIVTDNEFPIENDLCDRKDSQFDGLIQPLKAFWTNLSLSPHRAAKLTHLPNYFTPSSIFQPQSWHELVIWCGATWEKVRVRVSWSQSYNGANGVQHLYNISKSLNHPCCVIEPKSPILARFSLFYVYKSHINFLIDF